MAVNLSVKNVPEELAQKLRDRAQHNRRSLQRELLSILEAAASEGTAQRPVDLHRSPMPERGKLSIEEVAERARRIFPRPTGGESATKLIRSMRDGRYGDRWLRTGQHED